ncbi:hypothetical protein AAHE18_17G091500 [Arachis hypogaea]
MKLKSKTEKCAVEKKRKRKPEKIGDVEIDMDNGMQVGKEKKEKSSINRKRKNKDKNRRKGEVDLEEYSGKKKSKKKRKKEASFVNEDQIYVISSGDEDFSKGMRKWIREYHQSRQGLNILQEQIDEFITVHEENLEQEESGIAVGSVAQAVVENKMEKTKNKEVKGNFYRFQKKEAQKNEIMMLQSKFEDDKKRLQQLRAARKFRPY